MPATLEELFQSGNSKRDAFLSKLLGAFYEEIVRCWCRDSQAPYRDLGAPSIDKTYPIDFTFESRHDHKIYAGEMKCELQYNNYRYLTLESPDQLDHHIKPKEKELFRLFLDMAKSPSLHSVTVKVNGKPQSIHVDGAILVWGRCTDQGRNSVIAEHGFHDILSLEAIIADLTAWENREFSELLNKYEDWTNYLFSGLREIREL